LLSVILLSVVARQKISDKSGTLKVNSRHFHPIENLFFICEKKKREWNEILFLESIKDKKIWIFFFEVKNHARFKKMAIYECCKNAKYISFPAENKSSCLSLSLQRVQSLAP
jgi:hypothetical protein